MKRWIAAVAVAVAGLAGPAMASDDIVTVAAERDVAATADALQAAVESAGARVFARVDHGAGAARVGMELAPAELLIFGNPRLGTPAMVDDALAGLYLPMRVLVYRDGAGQVWLAYEDPAKMLGDLEGIGKDAMYVAKMSGALKKLTGVAAGN